MRRETTTFVEIANIFLNLLLSEQPYVESPEELLLSPNQLSDLFGINTEVLSDLGLLDVPFSPKEILLSDLLVAVEEEGEIVLGIEVQQTVMEDLVTFLKLGRQLIKER